MTAVNPTNTIINYMALVIDYAGFFPSPADTSVLIMYISKEKLESSADTSARGSSLKVIYENCCIHLRRGSLKQFFI